MLRKAVHKIASHGAIYDLIQTALGVKFLYRRIQKVFDANAGYRDVLDLGGGTGRVQTLLDSSCNYYCLDNEEPKLLQFRKRNLQGLAILGDATSVPVAAASMDLVVCIAVSHHLTDPQLQRMLRETTRILRSGGRLIFYDPLWASKWIPGRILWSLDRGSHPRAKVTLLKIVAEHLRIVHQEEFRLAHEYLLLVASKKGS
jgi:ubiquinone/menaquinone biosynthesis C-methylase UbiE